MSDTFSNDRELCSFMRGQKLSNQQDFAQALLNHPRIQNFFENHLDYKFKSAELFQEAITHRSFAHEAGFDLAFNERLEFLGDSILGQLVAQALFWNFPKSQEGELSRMRASLVNEEALADLALFIKLPEVILVGKGEEKNSGHLRPSILSSALEALLGAVYLDSDELTTKRMCLKIFNRYEAHLGESVFKSDVHDPKSQLQEKTMALYQSLPDYRFEQLGVGKDTHFRVGLYIQNVLVAEEINISKKRAQKLLAQRALKEELYRP